ncbi:hypothetical protein [Sphingobacterium sp. MYb382]|uniref:hypothetical protein n=1 Tax=Sphingobacterium sp. MYb382 TaxID=2745278 RepID=UPI0030AFE6A1
MKNIKKYTGLMLLFVGLFTVFTSCEDRDTPAGLPEFEHHYYIVYVPNNNSAVTVKRNQEALLKLPLQFYSEFTRDYDAVATYVVNTQGLPNTTVPAVLGEDYEIVNEAGQRIQPEDGKYKIVFPKAQKAEAAIYVKLLNNSKPGRRTVEINLVDNIQEKFRVDVFSTAFKRTLNID